MKEINMKINETNFIYKNYEENLETIKLINIYNSIIFKDSINKYFNKIPFNFENDTFNLERKIYDNEILGYDILLSIFIIEYNNKMYHLISYNPKNKVFYININLLNLLKDQFNEIYYEKLISIQDFTDLKQILIYLYLGFQFGDSEEKTNKINLLSLGDIYQLLKEKLNENFTLINKIYLFNIVDLNIFTNIYKDLINLKDKKHYSLSSLSYMRNIIIKLNNLKEIHTNLLPIPFGVNIKNEYEDKNQELTEEQTKTLNNLNYHINYILGIAGSGKTYLFSRYILNFKIYHAMLLAKEKENYLPLLYTSYSNSTNEILYEHISNSKIDHIKIDNLSFSDLILFINENNLNDKTIKSIEKRLSFNIKNIDINKYKYIKQKLIDLYEEYEIEEQLNLYNNLLKEIKQSNELFNILEKEELKKIFIRIVKIMNDLENNSIFFLFKKNKIVFNDDEMILLKKIYPHFKVKYNIKNNINDYNFIIDLIDKIDNLLNNNNDKSIFPLKTKFNTIKIENELTEEDIIYFLLTHIYFSKKKNIYFNLLKKLKNNNDLNKEELIDLKTIYPIHISNISHLQKYIPIDYNYYMTLIDESLLIPNYLIYSILSRSSYISLTGDVSQMSFYHLLPKNALNKTIDYLYGKYKKSMAMYLNVINGKVNSFYDILSYNQNFINNQLNINIFNNNFRYPFNIFKVLCLLSEEYIAYQSKNIFNKNIIANNDLSFYWNSFENIKKKFLNELFFLESDIDNKELNYIDIFKNLKIKENIELFNKNKKITLCIITSFASDKIYIKNLINQLKKNHSELFIYNHKSIYKKIEILSVYEVQGMEFDIIIYDTFLDKQLSEYTEILSTKPQIFNVALSRTKKLFFLIGKKQEFENIESNIHKNIRNVVNNFFTKLI